MVENKEKIKRFFNEIPKKTLNCILYHPKMIDYETYIFAYFSVIFSTSILSAISFVPSTYLNNNGETFKGFIEIPTDIFGKPMLQYMQNNVTFIKEDKSKTILKATDIAAFEFALEDKKYFYRSYINQLKPKVFWNENDKIFLQVVKSGSLTLLLAYDNIGTGAGHRADTNTSHGGVVMAKSYYLHKPGELLVEVHPFTFRKKVAAFLKDCPKVADAIVSKELKMKDIKKIVAIYNSNKSKQTSS